MLLQLIKRATAHINPGPCMFEASPGTACGSMDALKRNEQDNTHRHMVAKHMHMSQLSRINFLCRHFGSDLLRGFPAGMPARRWQAGRLPARAHGMPTQTIHRPLE